MLAFTLNTSTSDSEAIVVARFSFFVAAREQLCFKVRLGQLIMPRGYLYDVHSFSTM